MEVLEKVVLLHDGDIFAYRASAATDGRQYRVQWTVDGKVWVENLKYKKDADLKCAEVGGKLELIYEPEPETHAFHIVKTTMKQVKEDLRFRIKDFTSELQAEETYLTNKGSFREVIDPEYKVNRKDIRRPKHLNAAKDYLRSKHSAVTRPGELEADDLLAIRMTYWQERGYTPICVSIDKDLKQVPGWHWDFVKKELTYVTELEGTQSFYRQLLTGDSTDGIIGIKGCGPKTAEKAINGLIDEYEMYKECMSRWLKFMKQFKGESEDDWITRVVTRMHLNGRLLYLLRHEDEHWQRPKEVKHEEDDRSKPTIQGL